MAFYRVKKNFHKAVSRETGKTVAWVIGGRDADTFRRLFDKVKHLSDCQYYTDNWEAFAKVRIITSGNQTATVERDNSNTRHHLGRFAPK